MRIDIPIDSKKVHLLFSGGVDSTLLLYLLLLYSRENHDTQINCYGLNMSTRGIKFQRCKNIINILEKKFDKQISFKTFNRVFILREFAEMILSIEGGYVFSGCNKVLDFLNPANYIPNDTPPVRGEPFNEFHVRPFINIDKQEIISTYVEHDILDLLPSTYSCGYDLNIPCGNCYFCLERNWGLEMCGLTKDS